MQILVFSQNSIIKVLDAETKEPMAYVNVCFESLVSAKKDYTITNINGEATNICTDKCIVSLSFVAYKTLFDTLTANKSKTFYLHADVFNLEQVVVTATRTQKALKDAPVITQVITSENITNRGIENVKDVLEQDIPGLEFKRGGFGTDIKMQGLDAKNILILVDGERLAGETGNNVDYSRLNSDNVERIEIVKGAASALYGSQAMGGVINIITKKPKKKLEISFSSKYAQYNEINYPDLSYDDEKYSFKKNLDLPNLNVNASVGFNLKRISGRTDFSAKTFDAYQLYDKKAITKEFTNIDTVIYDAKNPFALGINGYKDYSISQKLKFRFSKKLDFQLNGSYYNHDEYDFVPDNVFQNYEDVSFGGKVNYAFSKDNSVVFSYHQDVYRKYDFYEKLDEKSKNYENTFINPKLVSNINIGKYQKLTSGLEYLSDELLSDKFSTDNLENKKAITSVFFIQDDVSINKRLSFIAGGRADYHTVFGVYISPKLSAMYKFKKLSLRGNYSKGFRSPSLKELYMDWPIAWFVIKGDENLQPETNNYFSASAEYTKDWLNTSATVYTNFLKNKIDGVWENGQTVYQYVNVSEATINGVEFLAKIKFLKHFLLRGAYSFLHDERPQGELPSSASPHSGNLGLSYHYTKKRYDLNVNLTSIIIGAKDYAVKEFINYQGQNVEGIYSVHFDAYSIWKLAVSQKIINGINLTLGIDNIFDYTADIVSFNSSTSPGRRLFVSLKIEVDKIVNKKVFNN